MPNVARAFGTQLLCEQVVGRGLRRQSYELNPETGLFDVEYAGVIEANVKVAQTLFVLATVEKNVAAAIFWMKARAGWREKMSLEQLGAGGRPVDPINIDTATLRTYFHWDIKRGSAEGTARVAQTLFQMARSTKCRRGDFLDEGARRMAGKARGSRGRGGGANFSPQR